MIIKVMEGVRGLFVGFPVGEKKKRIIGLYLENSYVHICSL